MMGSCHWYHGPTARGGLCLGGHGQSAGNSQVTGAGEHRIGSLQSADCEIDFLRIYQATEGMFEWFMYKVGTPTSYTCIFIYIYICIEMRGYNPISRVISYNPG